MIQPADPSRNRSIRVFVSSTFRDMQEERDYLVKVTFPQLRKLCESRGVMWGEVDLRWGITDEAQAEAQVLPVCLEEVDRCQPYFIGLLGERYGWVPDSIDEELVEHQPWLREHREQSVTELEMQHGVLRREALHGQAFFYFRDPGYLDRLPPGSNRTDFEGESPEAKQKLVSLKQRLRHAQVEGICRLREPYPEPATLGAWILADFTALINERFPEGSQPDPLDREALDHQAFAQSRAKVYIGRHEYFDRLDAHVAGEGPPLIVLGDSGSGKSALLANWFLQYQQAHPETTTLIHFIGATPFSADWAAMLRRLLGEFKRRFDIREEIPTDSNALRSTFANWLHRAAAKGRVVLILDALNQLEDRDGALDLVWLPPVIPANVRMILSTLPGRALDNLTKRGWPTLTVEPLHEAERKTLIGQYLAQYTKSLNPARTARIAAADQTANPLYLRILLDELRLHGAHETLEPTIAHYLKADTIPALYGKVLARWKRDYGGETDLVSNALSLLWAARKGLGETEWRSLLGTPDEPLPCQLWSPFFLAMEPHLAFHAGTHTFGHDFLRQAVRAEFLADREAEKIAHLRLARYFVEKKDVYPRKVTELFWQLRRAEAWDTLIEHLRHAQLVQETWESNRFDVTSTWTELESAMPGSLPRAYNFILRSLDGYVWMAGTFSGVADYLLVLAETFRFCGYPNETFKLCDAVLKYFGHVDVAVLWQAVKLQCSLFIERGSEGDLQTAWDLASKFRRMTGTSKNRRVQGAIMSVQETVLLQCNQSDAALKIVQEHKQLAREDEDRYGLAACLGNEAVALVQKGELAAALRIHKEEERLCREQDNLDGLQACLGNQATVLATEGLYQDALVLLAEQEQICSQIGKIMSLANCYSNQAFAHAKMGRRDLAKELLQQQEMLARRIGSEIQLRIAIEAQKALDGM